MKYSELLKTNLALGAELDGDIYEIVVLSNIIVSQIKEILEYSLRSYGINAQVRIGDYDNIVQDSAQFNASNAVIIFWEPSNLIDGFQYKAELMDDKTLHELIDKIKDEIDFVFLNLKETSLVMLNKLSPSLFSCNNLNPNNLDKVCEEINAHIEGKKTRNVHVIDIDRVLAKVSIEQSVNLRYFYSSKSLYSVEFLKEYSNFIRPIMLAANGKAKKAIIFDCDNTLWRGIIGEDGAEGIEMSNSTPHGRIFQEVQSIALAMSKKGILIGICSKNNSQDIDDIIKDHPDMILRDDNLAVKKVNWDDKVRNLIDISKDLNIGLDSLMFIDDSDFEINIIKEYLPQVTTLRVPSNIYEYPGDLRELLRFSHSLSTAKEDHIKTEMYREQAERENLKKNFYSLEDYLRSLSLKVFLVANELSMIPRMAQLTQKTNQFNLTTKRYTEMDISRFIKDDRYIVLAFEVEDKLGTYGVTGLAIINYDKGNRISEIDTFLMSCRVIGRNVEYAIFDHLVGLLADLKIQTIKASYIKTLKNAQVSDLFDRLGFTLLSSNAQEKCYYLDIADYRPRNLDYIEVLSGKQN